MAINSLGYLGITSQNVDAWRSFGTDVLGLQDVSVPQTEVVAMLLKMDEDWRLFIEATTDQLSLCGRLSNLLCNNSARRCRSRVLIGPGDPRTCARSDACSS